MGSLPICSWRFAFYLCSFFGGLSILYHVSVPGRLPAPPPNPQALAVHWAWTGGCGGVRAEGARAKASAQVPFEDTLCTGAGGPQPTALGLE